MTDTASLNDFTPRSTVGSRLLICLLLDTSPSMQQGNAIAQLTASLKDLCSELARRPEYARNAEVAVITFGNGGVRAVDLRDGIAEPAQPFCPVEDARPPTLSAGGEGTPMVEAIQRGLAVIDEHKQSLRVGRHTYYRPLLYLITDGGPTDPGAPLVLSDRWRGLVPGLRELEANKKLLFYAISVEGAVEEVMSGLAPDDGQLLWLSRTNLAAMVKQMSASIRAAESLGDSASAAEIYRQTRRLFDDQF